MLYLSIPSHLALSLLSTANKFHNEYKSQELQRNKTVGTQKVSLYGRYFLFSLFEVYIQKKRGVRLLPFHVLRLSHCLLV